MYEWGALKFQHLIPEIPGQKYLLTCILFCWRYKFYRINHGGGLKRWKCFMVVCPVALEDARFIRRKPGLKCIKQKDILDRAAWKDLSHALTFIHLVEYIIPDLFKQQAQSSLGPFVRLCEGCSCPKPDSLGDWENPGGWGWFQIYCNALFIGRNNMAGNSKMSSMCNARAQAS